MRLALSRIAGSLQRLRPRGVPPASSSRISHDAREAARLAEQVRTEKMASVGRLAAGLAHEVGNPLAAIQNYAHLLRSRVVDTAEATEILDGVERECARIDRIMRGLLDYARPRTPAPTPVDINETARAAVRLLDMQGVLRRAPVEMDLDEGAPRVFGERHELEQMFVNLLLNAVDAMPDGGRILVRTRRVARSEEAPSHRAGDRSPSARPRPSDPRLRIWVDRAGAPPDAVNVLVADAGTGVEEENRERIFEPFFTTKAPGRGTGLGLAIVSRVVDNLHGIVWVERAREGGAAFHLLFPAAESRARDVARAPMITEPGR